MIQILVRQAVMKVNRHPVETQAEKKPVLLLYSISREAFGTHRW